MPRAKGASPFLEQVRSTIRARYYSIRTEEAYVHWIRRYILFPGKRHPAQLRETEVAAFLTHLAVTGRVSPSTQNQALNALVFIYRHVLEQPLGDIPAVIRAKKPPKWPVVLTLEEVGQVLERLSGVYWIIGCLQYGSGLRLLESCRLRVKDFNFARCAVYVRTTQIYTLMTQRGGHAVKSPLGAVLGGYKG